MRKLFNALTKSIQIRHSFTHAWSNKGYALNSLGRYTEAVECFDKALELDPSYADAWHYKGVSLGNMEKYEEAVECFDKAMKILEPLRQENYPNIERDLADLYRKKAFVLGRSGEYNKAMEYFDRSIYKYQCIKNSIKNIEIDNDFAYAWNSKGYSIIYYLKYDNKLEVESVLNYFRKAIELRPDFAYPLVQYRFHFFESWKI